MILLLSALACTGDAPAPGSSAPPAPTPAAAAPSATASLAFQRDGEPVAVHPLGALGALAPVETVEAYDPYYGRVKRWRAVPLAPVLRAVFGGEDLASREFVLRATDGYTVPVSGTLLLEPGGYLALADADGAWEPIGPTRADPAPCYLVWSGEHQRSLDSHPRPWALAAIAIEPFAAVFPKVVPPAGSGPSVERGFALWRAQCVRCHAINQQGGKVGPELNVPRSVTEYRDDALLRAWIRDPSAFRPGAMPSFPSLSDDDLDSLLAYLRAMAGAKDPSLLPATSTH